MLYRDRGIEHGSYYNILTPGVYRLEEKAAQQQQLAVVIISVSLVVSTCAAL